MVGNINANLKSIYMTGFTNWTISVIAGRIPNTNPPQPPVQYVVGPPDAEGYQWPIVDPTGTPVCAMPPLPPDQTNSTPKVPNTIEVGSNIGGKWFSVGADDTFPAGMTTPPIPDASGALHTYEKYAAPVGAGWYLQVSSRSIHVSWTQRIHLRTTLHSGRRRHAGSE